MTFCRPLEGAANSELSEAKLTRLDIDDKEIEETVNSNLSVSLKKATNQTSSITAQNQHGLDSCSGYSSSLALGSNIGMSLGQSRHAENCDSSLHSGSKKRKEPDQDPIICPDLNLSLEELESIMSEEMDEPVQPAPVKKLCLARGDRSSSSNDQERKSNGQPRELKQQGVHNITQKSEAGKPGLVMINQELQIVAQNSTNKMEHLERESYRSKQKDHQGSSDIKKEEVSFVVVSRVVL